MYIIIYIIYMDTTIICKYIIYEADLVFAIILYNINITIIGITNIIYLVIWLVWIPRPDSLTPLRSWSFCTNTSHAYHSAPAHLHNHSACTETQTIPIQQSPPVQVPAKFRPRRMSGDFPGRQPA